jgi:hypothetical protein
MYANGTAFSEFFTETADFTVKEIVCPERLFRYRSHCCDAASTRDRNNLVPFLSECPLCLSDFHKSRFQSESALSFACNIRVSCDNCAIHLFNSCEICPFAHLERLSPAMSTPTCATKSHISLHMLLAGFVWPASGKCSDAFRTFVPFAAQARIGGPQCCPVDPSMRDCRPSVESKPSAMRTDMSRFGPKRLLNGGFATVVVIALSLQSGVPAFMP